MLLVVKHGAHQVQIYRGKEQHNDRMDVQAHSEAQINHFLRDSGLAWIPSLWQDQAGILFIIFIKSDE
jgi:hypothetical protein